MYKRKPRMPSRHNRRPRRHFNNNMKKVIDYVYNNVQVQKYKYTILEKEDDLQLLRKNKYYAAPNYNGTYCLFVFLKIMDRHYSVLIDKKTLSYDREKMTLIK